MTDYAPQDQQFDDPTPAEDTELDLENTALLDAAPRTLHELRVTLRGNGYGVEYKLSCLGSKESRCHIYADEEGGLASQHEECAVIDWFDDDRVSFVEFGYRGPDAPGITSGRIEILSYGEETEWQYAAAEASEWPVGSFGLDQS